VGGLALLALALVNLQRGLGRDRLWLSLFHLGLALAGLLVLQTWLIEWFERRRGGRSMALRRWLVPLLLAAPLFFLASGLAWLVGY
jgi:hypothetical protein